MTIRRVLILAPTLVILFLLQSYFWVPTYEQQTRGNPHRLNEFITASIGDASILNPILSADSASSDINSLVFEGLIDHDEELRFRGRLATSWEIYEEAFFFVNEQASIPGLGRVGEQKVVSFLDKARVGEVPASAELMTTLENIREVSLIPAREFLVTRQEKSEEGDKKTVEVRIRVLAPARIKLSLNRVDQDLFPNLSEILGHDYFTGFDGSAHITVNDERWQAKREPTSQ
ncbi:MAG: hypothetical protein JRF69_11770 [Deltaproteobacteria bacterium]|nr:hypothetical protein [Deltaproteobacteria bacterium]